MSCISPDTFAHFIDFYLQPSILAIVDIHNAQPHKSPLQAVLYPSPFLITSFSTTTGFTTPLCGGFSSIFLHQGLRGTDGERTQHWRRSPRRTHQRGVEGGKRNTLLGCSFISIFVIDGQITLMHDFLSHYPAVDVRHVAFGPGPSPGHRLCLCRRIQNGWNFQRARSIPAPPCANYCLDFRAGAPPISG